MLKDFEKEKKASKLVYSNRHGKFKNTVRKQLFLGLNHVRNILADIIINIFCCSGCGSTYDARSPKIEYSPKYMSTFSPNYNNDTIRLSTESFTSSVPENREHMVSSQNIKNM